MLIFFYIAVLLTGLVWAIRILTPEMSKPPLVKKTPAPRPVEDTEYNAPANRIEKLEIFLAEKNRNISLLQTEISILHAQVRSFDKVKVMLDEEIGRLREQNRIFRSELGLPAVQSKENSIT